MSNALHFFNQMKAARANRALSDMKERGLEPTKMLAWEVDCALYGVLVHAMEGHMKDARKLFQSMGKKGVEPGNVIYNMMIYGYGREGN
uniref:Pentacotripeptide-repeat region of PRORP domain-containing protein n=1 Tax=Oryza punctata TaxID=4537 RepID=A0A0E0JQV8_ORYPU